MESGKMQLFEEHYDTLSLFHDMKMTFENRIGDRPIELIYEIDQSIPCTLKGDMGRIRQIVMNLVSNAIKYTEKGYVHFSASVQQRLDDKILLYCEVEDSGIGIRNVMELKPEGYLLKSMEPKKLHAAIDDFFAKRA
ncbi:MAG: ATP-binding protein [Lachnospiraceae bacterium]|nr:ATP-binding protein [Lachnospiraceae bacterium]